jgi:hypothetical protein
MHSSKLIDVLKKIDAAKVNALTQYINTANTKKNNVLSVLFRELIKEHPSYSAEHLSKSIIFHKLYPDKSYNEKRMLQLMSDLLKLVEDFIVHDYISQNQLQKQYYLLQFYLEHNLTKYFESEFRQTNEKINSMPLDSELLAFKYKLELLQIQYQMKFNNRYCDYQDLYDSLQDFSRSQQYKLDSLCLINLYNNLEKSNEPGKLSYLYQSIHKLLSENNVELYFEMKEFILREMNAVAADELKTIIFMMVDPCIKNINKNQQEFLEELLFWYRLLIDRGIVLEANNTIASALFKNYVTIAIRLDKMEEASKFMEKFKNSLDKSEREDVYNYNKSNLLFHEGKFENALVLLNKTKFKDIFYKVSSKRLYIKIYYELSVIEVKKYEEVLDSALNAFKKYIYTSQEFTETVRERNKSFYKYVQKLANARYDQIALTRLYKNISQDSECADREWILAALRELSS